MKINGNEIKTPTTFDFVDADVQSKQSGRTTNGTMQMDIIRKVKNFELSWSLITYVDYKAIIGILDTGGPFYQLEYPDGDQILTCTVYKGDRKRSYVRIDGLNSLYRNFSFPLIEQ